MLLCVLVTFAYPASGAIAQRATSWEAVLELADGTSLRVTLDPQGTATGPARRVRGAFVDATPDSITLADYLIGRTTGEAWHPVYDNAPPSRGVDRPEHREATCPALLCNPSVVPGTRPPGRTVARPWREQACDAIRTSLRDGARSPRVS